MPARPLATILSAALAAFLSLTALALAQAPQPSEPPPCPPGAVCSPAPDGQPPPCPPGAVCGPAAGTCKGESGPVKLLKAAARKPGGDWGDALDKICVNLTYTEQPDPTGGTTRFVSFSAEGKQPIEDPSQPGTFKSAQDLASIYPKGTLFSLEIESSGPAPLIVGGAMEDPVVQIAGGKIAIQGKSTTVTFAFNYTGSGPNQSPDCAGRTETMESFFNGGIMLEPSGGGQAAGELRRYRGAFFGTNAQQNDLPKVNPDGSVQVNVAGCGRRAAAGSARAAQLKSSATAEGFFQGFLPVQGTAELGVDRSLLASVPEAAVDEMMKLLDNGKEQPDADFEPATEEDIDLAPTEEGEADTATAGAASLRAATPGTTSSPAGIAIDYRLSFSAHLLKTTSDRKDVAVAKRCKRKRGKLKVVKRGSRKALACVSRKKRR